MDWKALIDGATKVVEMIESPQIAQFAALGGPQAASVAKAVQGIAGVVDTVLTHAQDGVDIITAPDLEALTAVQVRIQAQGDAMDALVANET